MTSLCVSIYIYVDIPREREGERGFGLSLSIKALILHKKRQIGFGPKIRLCLERKRKEGKIKCAENERKIGGKIYYSLNLNFLFSSLFLFRPNNRIFFYCIFILSSKQSLKDFCSQ